MSGVLCRTRKAWIASSCTTYKPPARRCTDRESIQDFYGPNIAEKLRDGSPSRIDQKTLVFRRWMVGRFDQRNRYPLDMERCVAVGSVYPSGRTSRKAVTESMEAVYQKPVER